MNRLIAVVILVVLVFLFQDRESSEVDNAPAISPGIQPDTGQTAIVSTTSPPAFRSYSQRDAGRQISDSGSVIRILADDNDGSRHQRFIIRLASGQTLLVAHNIDLAPRVAGISVNDTVEFNGEYEWNSQGGVVHWTHRDPAGRHESGWLRHKGRTYQ